jgi:hypothetical protein
MTDPTPPEDSILKTTKKLLQVDLDEDAFDLDIITYINGVFSNLLQIGVGPTTEFQITDDSETWADFIGTTGPALSASSVRMYMGMKVRLLFDPPATSFDLAAKQQLINEMEFRLKVQQDERRHPWVAPELQPTFLSTLE